MKFTETKLTGAFIVDIERKRDDRGYFARTFCAEEFRARGLTPLALQTSLSFNVKRGTLRGLHFQYPPAAETKYVRCRRGSLFDVIVDLRPESPTYLDHIATVLSAENGAGLYIPKRFAHGFITLEDDTEVEYLTSEAHTPNAEGGVRFDDPRIGVQWPLAASVLSQRDALWPTMSDIADHVRYRMRLSETV